MVGAHLVDGSRVECASGAYCVLRRRLKDMALKTSRTSAPFIPLSLRLVGPHSRPPALSSRTTQFITFRAQPAFPSLRPISHAPPLLLCGIPLSTSNTASQGLMNSSIRNLCSACSKA